MVQGKGGGRKLRRIMIYTHNSIGLGHAVRTMALIDGMRRADPELQWLVLSGTSAPGIFLDNGVEVVRLPGVRRALDVPGQPYLPRILDTFAIDGIIRWRAGIIEQCLGHFRPDVIMIEHSPAGLMGDVSPLLAAGAARNATGDGPLLVHLSRGIYGLEPGFIGGADDCPCLPPGSELLRLYRAFYVLEERRVVDVNREFFGNDPALEERIRYLGRIAVRNADELKLNGEPPDVPGNMAKPFILLSLGRFGRIGELHLRIIAACRKTGIDRGREILVVPDVYLKPETLRTLSARAECVGVRFTRFIPNLVEVMARADLVVCRAGYNMVNEIMLTGVRALVIPESHPSGEQERRAASLSGPGIIVRGEAECLSGDVEGDLASLLRQPVRPPCGEYDRFRIGRIIVEELEAMAAGN